MFSESASVYILAQHSEPESRRVSRHTDSSHSSAPWAALGWRHRGECMNLTLYGNHRLLNCNPISQSALLHGGLSRGRAKPHYGQNYMYTNTAFSNLWVTTKPHSNAKHNRAQQYNESTKIPITIHVRLPPRPLTPAQSASKTGRCRVSKSLIRTHRRRNRRIRRRQS